MKWTIQFKMVVLFSVIVFIGFSVLLILSNKVAQENMYREVHEDMVQSKRNLDIALNQYFLIHNKRMSRDSLEAGSREARGADWISRWWGDYSISPRCFAIRICWQRG